MLGCVTSGGAAHPMDRSRSEQPGQVAQGENEMKNVEIWKAQDAMSDAGQDAFNRGEPCVPGLDPLWHRERRYGMDPWSDRLAKWWRMGWGNQAEIVHHERGGLILQRGCRYVRAGGES